MSNVVVVGDGEVTVGYNKGHTGETIEKHHSVYTVEKGEGHEEGRRAKEKGKVEVEEGGYDEKNRESRRTYSTLMHAVVDQTRIYRERLHGHGLIAVGGRR